MSSHAAGLQLAGAVAAGILLWIVSVSWLSFLIIGVPPAAYEVCLQRIKPPPPDEAPPASGPGTRPASRLTSAKPQVKTRNLLTQLGEWTRPEFFTRTGFGTHALNTPTPEMSSANGPDSYFAALIASDAGGALEATTVAGKLIRRGRRQGADRSSSDVTALGAW
jgi:hypothetical protein